ncbi:MAG: hypothetical protein H7230_00855 [Candidatus Parcubacteria bacterium]|nr:hypothetical protein [Candidatus Paceibacterota bacterium]
MKYLYLDCLLQSDSNSRYLRCVVDTGFDGDLLINAKVAQSLKLIPIPGKASNTILGDGKAILTRLANVIFELPEIAASYNVVTVILPQEIDCILGTAFLEKICRSNKSNLVVNYMTNSLDFVSMI